MKYLIHILILTSLIACTQEFATPEVKTLYESVMKIHDDVMPEMSTMNKIKRTIKKSGNESIQSKELIERLEDADEGMMSWMSEFKLDKDASVADQISYLNEEQLKITKVAKDMNSVIFDGNTYIAKLK